MSITGVLSTFNDEVTISNVVIQTLAEQIGAKVKVTMDSGGRHDPAEIPKLLIPLNSSRFKDNNMYAGSELIMQIKDHNLKFEEVKIRCNYNVEDASSQTKNYKF